ncbi:phospholipase D family protein [Sandarakinorhabdus sp.]|uniref:phospholipase D-like domain-containing protein n=1 Tax=Sandarakinorhabdus sp. TaxID=1916663 RepID=UPI00286E6B01|nr:phospholipase D family protein [Sandarakinorhabdus sp.]
MIDMTAAAAGTFATALAWLLVRHWLRLPVPHSQNTHEHARRVPATGPLAALLGPLCAARPGKSGVQLLHDGPQSLAVRLLLIRKASVCIDVQYYIWRDDVAGGLLLDALEAAADRGVQVRLLLDDFGTTGLDARLMHLDSHPGIAVRLVNPFRLRRPKLLNLLFDFSRLNRRMHNKGLVVDGVAAVIGGRNIGDEYFDAGHAELVTDLDVLAIGAIVAAVDADFDSYWHCAAAYPLASIVRPQSRSPAAPSGTALRARYESAAASDAVRALMDETSDFEWADVCIMSDPPGKLLGVAAPSDLLLPKLLAALSPISRRLVLVSAYFVPMAEGIRLLADLAARGVQVDVLTNSLRSGNVVVVHAGYAPLRRRLLAAGVRLWEMKGSGAGRVRLGLVPRRLRRNGSSASFFRTSASALHAKTFIADGTSLFVGSVNFDPRSWRLNTEVGFLIAAPALAARLEAELDAALPEFAWSLRLEDGQLAWDSKPERLDAEPGTAAWQRAAIWLVGRLPFAWML